MKPSCVATPDPSGFTLIEMLVILVILSILAVIALPDQTDKYNRLHIQESLALVEPYKANVTAFYAATGHLPKDNREAGIPEADKILGNYLLRVDLDEGALQLTLGNKVSSRLQGGTVSIRPAIVPGEPMSPVSWLCGYQEPVTGMEAMGNNLTTVPEQVLPASCR